MTKLFPLLLLFMLSSGCAVIGRRTIHSPDATNGIPLREFHVHGGVTKGSPPDGVILNADGNDSLSVILAARPLKEKSLLGGIIFPIFPVFFLPASDYYKGEPGILVISMKVPVARGVAVYPDSMKVQFGNKIYIPIKKNYTNEELDEIIQLPDSAKQHFIKLDIRRTPFIELKLTYNIDAHTAEEFTFLVNGIYHNKNKSEFPQVNFSRRKQTTRFIGP